MRICIDPGHGGPDPGATYAGVNEKDVNLNIAKLAAVLLQGRGHFADLTRQGDVSMTLSDRVAKADILKADLFVSIHCNAAASSKAHGVETWRYANSGRGLCLAYDVHDKVVAVTGARNRGVKGTTSLYVLKFTRMPAILIECGFLSNGMERELLAAEPYQQSIAGAIAEGIDTYIRRGTS